MRRYVKKESERERAKRRIYQSDNGSELKNKIMRESLAAIGVEMKHSREYTPSTNGKINNRVKQISRKVTAELGGYLKGKTNKDIERALESAIAILNFNPSSITSHKPYEVSMYARS